MRAWVQKQKKQRWRNFSDFQTESGHLLGKIEEEVRSSAPPMFQDPPSGLRVAQRRGDSKERNRQIFFFAREESHVGKSKVVGVNEGGGCSGYMEGNKNRPCRLFAQKGGGKGKRGRKKKKKKIGFEKSWCWAFATGEKVGGGAEKGSSRAHSPSKPSSSLPTPLHEKRGRKEEKLKAPSSSCRLPLRNG